MPLTARLVLRMFEFNAIGSLKSPNLVAKSDLLNPIPESFQYSGVVSVGNVVIFNGTIADSPSLLRMFESSISTVGVGVLEVSLTIKVFVAILARRFTNHHQTRSAGTPGASIN